jgi:hypothetical protein
MCAASNDCCIPDIGGSQRWRRGFGLTRPWHRQVANDRKVQGKESGDTRPQWVIDMAQVTKVGVLGHAWTETGWSTISLIGQFPKCVVRTG